MNLISNGPNGNSEVHQTLDQACSVEVVLMDVYLYESIMALVAPHGYHLFKTVFTQVTCPAYTVIHTIGLIRAAHDS